MLLKRGRWRFVSILFLVVIFIAIGLAGLGCVEGLRPIGWSGGAVSDGTLFVGSSEGRLVAVNISDESRQWSTPLKQVTQPGGLFGCAPAYGGGCGAGASGVAIYGTPVISGELVHIAGYNGKVYAYNIETLAMRWVYPRDDYLKDEKNQVVPIVGGLAADQGRLYFGGSDGKVYALDAFTGDRLWELATGDEKTRDKIWSTPAVIDNTVYIGSFDKKLYALNADDGSVRWEYITEGSIITTPLVHNGTVYFGSFDRHFYAVNTADGSLKWKFMAENWFWARPVIYGDTIYAGCLDGKVYALRADNGVKVTEFYLGSPVSSSPVVVDSSIVFVSREGVVYAIDASTDRLSKLAVIEENVYGPLAVHEGIVYIHTQDLMLHRVNALNGAVLRSISLKSQD